MPPEKCDNMNPGGRIMKLKKKVCVSLSEEQYRIIEQLANETFRTRAGYIRRVLTLYLDLINKHPEYKIR